MKTINVVVIYSNARKESTYSSVQIFKNTISKKFNIIFKEFFLPADMPHLCLGCFSCFQNGENTCPHSKSVQPIVNAILEADGLIISSPVYSCDASCSIKSLFDHMCYLWISHRPKENMFNKVVMVVSTTAGIGIKSSIKTLKKSPRYWGAKRIYSYGITIRACQWCDVSSKLKTKITRDLTNKSKKFTKAITHIDSLKSPLYTRFLFSVIGKMIANYDPNGLLHKDMEYWNEKGWFGKTRPF